MSDMGWPMASVLIVAVVCLTLVLMSLIEAVTRGKGTSEPEKPAGNKDPYSNILQEGGDKDGRA